MPFHKVRFFQRCIPEINCLKHLQNTTVCLRGRTPADARQNNISVKWDRSVQSTFHKRLQMPEPVYQYEQKDVFPIQVRSPADILTSSMTVPLESRGHSIKS